jgi:hypothetical protein
LPVNAFAIGRVSATQDVPLILDGQPLSEQDGLGYEHR